MIWLWALMACSMVQRDEEALDLVGLVLHTRGTEMEWNEGMISWIHLMKEMLRLTCRLKRRLDI